MIPGDLLLSGDELRLDFLLWFLLRGSHQALLDAFKEVLRSDSAGELQLWVDLLWSDKVLLWQFGDNLFGPCKILSISIIHRFFGYSKVLGVARVDLVHTVADQGLGIHLCLGVRHVILSLITGIL